MAGNARWAFIFVMAAALAGLVLVASTGSASAAAISGTITDSRKTPVPGATVTLYQAGLECMITDNPTTTGVNGYYLFSGLPAGDYSVSVEVVADGIYSTTATTHVEDADVTMDMKIPGYTYSTPLPTLPPYVVTAPPVATSTATPKPTPTKKPSNTPVPLPTLPAEPGFEALMAVMAIGLLAAAKLSARR